MILKVGHVYFELGINFKFCGGIVITWLLYLISIQLTLSTSNTLWVFSAIRSVVVIYTIVMGIKYTSNNEMTFSDSRNGGQVRWTTAVKLESDCFDILARDDHHKIFRWSFSQQDQHHGLLGVHGPLCQSRSIGDCLKDGRGHLPLQPSTSCLGNWIH